MPPHDLDGRGQALLTRGRLALVRLEPMAARAAFRIALDYAEERESVSYQSVAWAGLASARIALGDVVAAAEALRRAQALHAQVGERALELQLAWTEGDLALLRGDLDAAERHYGRAIAQCREGEIASSKSAAPCSAWHASTSRLRTRRGRSSERERLRPSPRAGSSAACCRSPD